MFLLRCQIMGSWGSLETEEYFGERIKDSAAADSGGLSLLVVHQPPPPPPPRNRYKRTLTSVCSECYVSVCVCVWVCLSRVGSSFTWAPNILCISLVGSPSIPLHSIAFTTTSLLLGLTTRSRVFNAFPKVFFSLQAPSTAHDLAP